MVIPARYVRAGWTQGEPRGSVKLGLDSYSTSLSAAGGKQVNALARCATGNEICAALYQAPAFDLSVPALPVSRLSINLTSAEVEGGIEGDRVRRFSAGRYSIFLAPAGAEMRWCKKAPSRHLNIYFSPDAFDGDGGVGLAQAMSEPLFNLSVPGIRSIAGQLVEELTNPNPHGVDAVDSLARLFIVHLSRQLGRQTVASQSLGSATQARLRAYIMAHLAERIRVADLAALVGLSSSSFAFICKEETGQSPHQLVLALRLEHACDLLRNSRLTMAEISYACGFASQQHLTTTMRQYLNITPRRYRDNELRGPVG